MNVRLLGFTVAHRPETDPTQRNTVHDPHSSAAALHCSQSYYGCCPDGRTSAGGPRGLGCPRGPAPVQPEQPFCMQSRYPAATCLVVTLWLHQRGLDILTTVMWSLVLSASYGCCQDGVTASQGPNKEGCVEYVAPAPTVSLGVWGKLLTRLKPQLPELSRTT